jgi:hypothetical protein
MKRFARVLTLAVCVAVALVLLAPGSAFAVRRLALSSGSFKFEAGAGQNVDGNIVVINDGDEAIKVLVYSADQVVDAKGGLTFQVPSRSDLSAIDLPSAWMHVSMPENANSVGNIPYLELKPKQRVPIKFSVRVPADSSPGDHNIMLFFEMFSGQGIGKGAGTEISGRIGTRIQLRVKGDLVQRLDVSRYAVPAFVIGDQVPAQFTVHNAGNTDERVVATLQLLDRNDDPVLDLKPINNRLVFAQKNFEASGTLLSSTQLIGPYTARLQVVPVNEEGQPLNSGKDTIIEKRAVWIIPLWLVIVVAVIAVLLVLWIVWSAGRRSAAKRAAKAAAVTPPAPVVTPEAEVHKDTA